MGTFASALLAVASLVVGVIAGFLLLALFPPGTFIVVQVFLLALALATLIGVLRRYTSLAIASVFFASTIAVPFFSDLAVVGLPACGAVSPGLACLTDATRVRIEFVLDVVVLAISLIAVVTAVVRWTRRLTEVPRSY